METRHTLPELLAPAGDWTCLQAATDAGADAVYLGVEGLNMRATARNFTCDNLPEISRHCRQAGLRVYLTLNTIVFTDEIEQARETLSAACGNVDAVICWDPAVLALCRELSLPFHISTQASIANVESARFYKSLGAERIVPARECTLEEVARIRRETGIEVELFVHGAMCVNFSGRCFLSQDVFGKSGNRGECVQPCRREYFIKEVEDGDEYIVGKDYVMSARDVCTLPFLEQLVEMGIDSLKIEGRNRNPEYVDTVVRCYRRALDACAAGQFDEALKTELMGRLEGVFNRNFSEGFYHGRPIAEFAESRGSQAEFRKELVGVVSNYYARIGVVEITVQSNAFRPGDEMMIQGPTTGVLRFRPVEIRVNGKTVDAAPRGVVTLRLDEKVRRGDKVFIRVSREGKRAGE
ncbi:MAG: U32 family peptidase [Lentisphaeria bacterium]|nr:U32 family peptidase [Lentisphaeria bacterium]